MYTIVQVVKLAEIAQSRKLLNKCMTSSQFHFRLTNVPNLIRPLINFVNECMANHNLGNEALRRQTSVAVEEALINAMFHGNLELTPIDVQTARREMHAGTTSKIVQTRCKETIHSQRRIMVHVDFRPPMVKFTVRDEGPGFNVNELPAVEELENISSPKVGRGLTLIAQLMDHIEFNEAGNQIHMSLECHPE